MAILTPEMIQFMDMVEKPVDFMRYDLSALGMCLRWFRLQLRVDGRQICMRGIRTDTEGGRGRMDRRVVGRWHPRWLGGLQAVRT